MDEPIVYLFKYMWRFSPSKPKVVLYMALSLCSQVFTFLEPIIIAWLLNTLQTEGLVVQKLLGILSIILLLELLSWAFHLPARILEERNAFHVRANFKDYLLKGTLDLPPAWHTAHHSGDTIDRIERASTGLYEYARTTFFTIEISVLLVASYIALSIYNIHSVYIVLFLTVLGISMVVKYDKILRKQYGQLFEFQNKVAAKVFDSISNITTVLVLKLEKLIRREVWEAMMNPFALDKKRVRTMETKWFIVFLVSSLMIVFVMGSSIVSHAMSGEVLLVGNLFALYGYLSRIKMSFIRFSFTYGEIVQRKSAVENVEPIMREFREKETAASIPMKIWKELRIEHLSFSYHGDEGNLHLRDVNLTIKRGEKVALVGESGGGKTTFLKLLRGLYKPRKLQVSLDGNQLPQGFKSIEDHISLVPQEPELFATTVKENITLGISYPWKKVIEYSKMARFHAVAERLPHKYESAINERGVNLSGGERQRLALVRGLLASEGREIIMMDEPTSSVDAENERAIFDKMFKKFNKATIIATVHRLHLLDKFNRIFFFSKGKIVATGTLDEVLKNPQFKRLYKKAR